MAPVARRVIGPLSMLLVAAFALGAAAIAQTHGGKPKSPVIWTPESLPYTGHVTTSYGFSVINKLKYPAGFRHFDYVNPEAPKGGTFRGTSAGSFDSLNGFIVLGTPPITFRLSAPPTETLMMRPFDEQNSQYGLLADRASRCGM